MAKKIQRIVENEFGCSAAVGVAFTLESDGWDDCHFVTNVSRDDGIRLFRDTANYMQGKVN